VPRWRWRLRSIGLLLLMLSGPGFRGALFVGMYV
jgi:hypothetical protein